MKHIPVLYFTILDLLDPKPGETVVDVTLGLGGHAKGFLEKIGPQGRLIGLDADLDNLESAANTFLDRALLQRSEWRDLSTTNFVGRSRKVGNVELIHANFKDIAHLDLGKCGIIFADLGLSSPHLDDPEKGFSFRSEGPLDCRYDRSQGMTAADVLNRESERTLLDVFKKYGEVERARPLVREVLKQRDASPFKTTQSLVEVAETVYKWKAKQTLPQIFQALRIAVNNEVDALEELLKEGPNLLSSGGRFGIISYHSLEDRMVKQRFRDLTTAPKHPVLGSDLSPAPFELLTKKAVQSEESEIENNPRARSARFRVIRKR